MAVVGAMLSICIRACDFRWLSWWLVAVIELFVFGVLIGSFEKRGVWLVGEEEVFEWKEGIGSSFGSGDCWNTPLAYF